MSTSRDNSPPDENASLTVPRVSWLRKWWPWLLAVGLLAFGLVLGSLDEQPPDVSDLKFDPVVLLPEENGFHLFAEAAFAAKKAVPSTDDGTDEGKDLLDDMRHGEIWDEARVVEWMAALEPVWPLLEKASKSSAAQASRIKELSDATPEVGPVQKLVCFAALKTKHDLREGRPEDAVETAVTSLRSSVLLQKSRGSLLIYLTAIASKGIALKSIEEIARDPQVTLNQLRKILDEIEAARELGEGLRYALRNDIYLMESAQRMVAKSGFKGMDGDPLKSIPLLNTSKIPGLYKPNKTLRIYAKNLRAAIVATRNDQSTLAAYEASNPASGFAPNGIGKYNPENIYGRTLLLIAVPHWSGIMRIQLTDQSRNSAYQAFIALHLYQRDHGEFPATLDALVPTYLPAVPKDYLDDAPIRYSAELGVVWSIGKNGLNITSADQNTDAEIALWLVPRKPKQDPESTEPTPDNKPTPTPISSKASADNAPPPSPTAPSLPLPTESTTTTSR